MSLGRSSEDDPFWWADDGACRGRPPEWWFPVDHFPDGREWATPKSICKKCPVKNECLEYALSYRERHGMWGGATPDERKQIIEKFKPRNKKRKRKSA